MNASWVEVAPTSHFPITNLPYGIFSTPDSSPRVGVAIGDYVLDLSVLAMQGVFQAFDLAAHHVFSQPTLNAFIASGKKNWSGVRAVLQNLLAVDNPTIRDDARLKKRVLYKQSEVTMHLPLAIGDYTDFYSSKQHATNVGMMFRDPANALLPNWKHLPVGYHGRASSIVVSGTDIIRPKGQIKLPTHDNPVFGPSRKMDFELEMAWVVGKPNQMGQTVAAADWKDHVFGFGIFNDWSARDHQSWEYVPLGPFLGKNFGSSISPWVVTLDALTPLLVEGEVQVPEVLPYLKTTGPTHFDVDLEVWLQPEGKEASLIATSNYKYLYWSVAQQLAHHTVNGCNLRVGDLCASGTISGDEPHQFGSMLELSWNGTKPIKLADGSERAFLEDGDTVIMRAYKDLNGQRIGFGEVKSKLLPAI